MILAYRKLKLDIAAWFGIWGLMTQVKETKSVCSLNVNVVPETINSEPKKKLFTFVQFTQTSHLKGGRAEDYISTGNDVHFYCFVWRSTFHCK